MMFVDQQSLKQTIRYAEVIFKDHTYALHHDDEENTCPKEGKV